MLDGPPTPGVGLGGRDRADPAGSARAAARRRELVDLFVALADRDGGARRRSSWRARRGAPGLSAQLELAGRSLKGQLRHADRIGARYVAIVGDERQASLKEMESGEQHEHRAAERDPDDPPRSERRLPMKHAPRPNGYRDTLVRAS